MRRGTVVNLNRIKFFDSVVKNKLIILITLFFVLGIISGSIAVSKELKIAEISKNFFDFYLKNRVDKSVISIIINSFLTSACFLIGMFICGTSMLGTVLSPLGVYFTGFLSGGFCAYIYSEFSLKGIAFNSVIIVPSFIIFIICFIFSACDAVKFSLVLVKLSLPNSHPLNLYLDFKRYCSRFLIFLIISLCSGIIDSLISNSFLKYFELY